jgi:hypothetical protein
MCCQCMWRSLRLRCTCHHSLLVWTTLSLSGNKKTKNTKMRCSKINLSWMIADDIHKLDRGFTQASSLRFTYSYDHSQISNLRCIPTTISTLCYLNSWWWVLFLFKKNQNCESALTGNQEQWHCTLQHNYKCQEQSKSRHLHLWWEIPRKAYLFIPTYRGNTPS